VTLSELKITAKAYKTILRWAQSQREIGFICAGRKNIVTHVYRIKNIDSESRIAFIPHAGQERAIRSAVKTNGMSVLSAGHSHPNQKDTPMPSRADCEFIRQGFLEIIIAPSKNEVRCWRMNKSRSKTLKQEVPIKIVGRTKDKNER
jgi:proteasome lid subunit RPN8/RPN11